MMVMNGQGISQWWSQLVKESQNVSSLKDFVAQSRALVKGTTSLDLDRDILGWIDGEFALGIIPVTSGSLGDLGLGGVLLLETTDRLTATNTLNNLKTQIPPFFQLKETDNQGVSLTEWKTIQGQTALSYGWPNNNLVLLSFGASLNPLLTTQPQNTLTQSPDFQRPDHYPKKTVVISILILLRLRLPLKKQ